MFQCLQILIFIHETSVWCHFQINPSNLYPLFVFSFKWYDLCVDLLSKKHCEELNLENISMKLNLKSNSSGKLFNKDFPHSLAFPLSLSLSLFLSLSLSPIFQKKNWKEIVFNFIHCFICWYNFLLGWN